LKFAAWGDSGAGICVGHVILSEMEMRNWNTKLGAGCDRPGRTTLQRGPKNENASRVARRSTERDNRIMICD
jgi:hypothetical protein